MSGNAWRVQRGRSQCASDGRARGPSCFGRMVQICGRRGPWPAIPSPRKLDETHVCWSSSRMRRTCVRLRAVDCLRTAGRRGGQGRWRAACHDHLHGRAEAVQCPDREQPRGGDDRRAEDPVRRARVGHGRAAGQVARGSPWRHRRPVVLLRRQVADAVQPGDEGLRDGAGAGNDRRDARFRAHQARRDRARRGSLRHPRLSSG